LSSVKTACLVTKEDLEKAANVKVSPKREEKVEPEL